MMLQKLKKISSKQLFENNWWQYRVDEYTWPDGSVHEYHYVRTSGSTMIIPRLNETTFVLIRQYRYLNGKVSLEFPGGGMKQGLTVEENARAELKEEAGYIAEKLTELGTFNPFKGVTDEISTVLLADGLEFIGGQPDPSEEFEIVNLSFNDINEKIKTGELWDGMSLASWVLYLTRREL